MLLSHIRSAQDPEGAPASGSQRFAPRFREVQRRRAPARVHSLLLAAASLTACGNDVDVELVWGGPPDPNTAGIVSADGFAAYQGNVDEHWERSAAMAAAEFLRLDERAATRTTIEGKAPAEGMGPQTVTVTLDGLADDSIRAERWSLAFEQDGETYRLTTALREQRCQPNRGHQGFSADDCI